MNDAEPDRRSRIPFAWLWRWWCREWRRTAVILIIFFAVLLVVRGIANVWIGHQLNDEVARLEKVYGRLDLASLRPPGVSPGENRARVMRAAANLMALAPGDPTLDRFTTRSMPSRPRATAEDLRRVVDSNRLALEVAAEGRRRPKSNWEIRYAEDYENFPPLMDLRKLGELLEMSCQVHLDAGDIDAAAQAALAGLAEASSLRQESTAIIPLIRIAIADGQLGCIRDVLMQGEPSATALSDLASALAENRTPDVSRTMLLSELMYINDLYARMELGKAHDFGGVNPGPVLAWLCRPLIRYSHLQALRTADPIIQAESKPPFRRSASDLPRPPARSWDPLRLFSTFLFGFERAALSIYEFQSELNAAEASVALRRFRLEHGAYPDTLAALVPQYLPEVPIDPFTGRPPDYTRDGAGFTVRAHGKQGSTVSRLLEWKIPR